MKLILEAIKALFRKAESGISDLRTKVQTAQATADTATMKVTTAKKTADGAQKTADSAYSLASIALAEAKNGIRYYGINSTYVLRASKQTQLNVGEKTVLSEHPTPYNTAINNYNIGDVVTGYFSIYDANGEEKAINVNLTKVSVIALKGGTWVVVDDIAQYYEVVAKGSATSSTITRYV